MTKRSTFLDSSGLKESYKIYFKFFYDFLGILEPWANFWDLRNNEKERKIKYGQWANYGPWAGH
jgi:hypothetical protein